MKNRRLAQPWIFVLHIWLIAGASLCSGTWTGLRPGKAFQTHLWTLSWENNERCECRNISEPFTSSASRRHICFPHRHGRRLQVRGQRSSECRSVCADDIYCWRLWLSEQIKMMSGSEKGSRVCWKQHQSWLCTWTPSSCGSRKSSWRGSLPVWSSHTAAIQPALEGWESVRWRKLRGLAISR